MSPKVDWHEVPGWVRPGQGFSLDMPQALLPKPYFPSPTSQSLLPKPYFPSPTSQALLPKPYFPSPTPQPSRPYENVDIRKLAKNGWIEKRPTEWTLSVSRSRGGRPCIDW